MLPLRRIKKTLGETDPAGTQPVSVRGEHQVFGSQCAVFDDPLTWRVPRNKDEYWRVVEDVKVFVIE